MRCTNKRMGFTLIELMVVMAIIAFLSAIVMLAAPSILDKDRARDAATQLQGALQNARLRAMRDGSPRGVRLLIDKQPAAETVPGPFQFNGVSYSPSGGLSGTGSLFTTSSAYQYIEVPPWLLMTNISGTNANPFLQLTYNLGTQQGNFNQVLSRTCTIGNMTQSQWSQLQQIVGSKTQPPLSSLPPVLGLPTLGFWTTIILNSFTDTTNPPKQFPYSCTIQLTLYPDAMIGAQTSWVATLDAAGGLLNSNSPASTTINGPAYFGIYQAPKPLLGEPIVSMPLNTAVDLSDGVSKPSFSQYPTAGGTGGYGPGGQLAIAGYDVLFSPSGQMMAPFGVGQVFLWVRNPTKGAANPAVAAAQLQVPNQYAPNPDPANPLVSISPFQWVPTSSTTPYSGPWTTTLPTGGEQLLVTIKANSGATGVAPVYTPILPTDTPYNYALKTANAP